MRQSGGHGQYGVVNLEVEPTARGEGFEFVDKVVGGVVPRQFIPAVEKGVRETLDQGVIAGYPGGRRALRAGVRQVPPGGLERSGVQDGWLGRLQGRVLRRPTRCCSSR